MVKIFNFSVFVKILLKVLKYETLLSKKFKNLWLKIDFSSLAKLNLT